MNPSGPCVVVLSGCHAGPNPSPGLGTALSIRSAFPDSVIIAKDHSPQASGLHHPVFDKVFCFRPWNELDLSLHRSHLMRLLDEHSAVFVSGLDLEVHWIAQNPFPGVLAPPASALKLTRKPHVKAAAELPVRIPRFIGLNAGHDAVYEFCATAGWNVWLKGPAYEARKIQSWSQLEAALSELEATWGVDLPFFIQEHVSGWEVSVAFAAFQGDLLEAVFMEKRLVTPEGKTWAGAISPCPETFLADLRRVVRQLSWTGGAELEFVRSPSGDLWLIDWNPRFPAWIHGATICGHNLPAALIARAFQLQRPRSHSHRCSQFTRVVLEVPVRMNLPLPPPPEQIQPDSNGTKHPSGMPLLMQRADGPFSREQPSYGMYAVKPRCHDGTDESIAELLELWPPGAPTPSRVFLPRTASRRFTDVALCLERINEMPGPEFRMAYSIKTDPDRRFLVLARESGMLAEAISPDEVVWAMSCGFRARDVIYNGPYPPVDTFSLAADPLLAVFADSYICLERLLGMGETHWLHIGARLRLPGMTSRFGIRIDDQYEFDRLCQAFRSADLRAPLALSFHVQSSVVGVARWSRILEAFVDVAACVESAVGRSLAMLDLGGGWTPAGLDVVLSTGLLDSFRTRVQRLLPNIQTIILEPGKALCQDSVMLVTRVVEVRRSRSEIVVDASLSELPLAHEVARNVYYVDKERRVSKLHTGRARILGRLCMENDILVRRIEIPEGVSVDDLIIFGSAGAYDKSMSYKFGRGGKTGL